MLQQILLEPKMEQHFLFSPCRSLVLLGPPTINLWSRVRTFLSAPSPGHGSISVCIDGGWWRGHTVSLAINTVGAMG